MRPGLSAAGGAGAALLTLGAFAAFAMTRPPPRAQTAEVSGAPVRRNAAQPAAAKAPAQGSLQIVLGPPHKAHPPPEAALRPSHKNRPQPDVARRGPAAASQVRSAPARAVPTLARAVPAPARAVPAADVFRVRLQPSTQTPRGYAYADALRAVLARDGATAARPSGRVIWAVDREFVARLADGSRIAVAGGYGVTQLSFRELTPQTCRLLFGAAEASGSYLAAPGAGRLQPPRVGAAADRASGAEPVAGARELCLRLAPAFEAWRRAAPPAPRDLADLDRRRLAISSPDVRPFPAQPGSLAAARRSLFY